MMGFGWGTAGISVPFVGMLADRIGIERALMVMAFMPLLAATLAIPLPSGARSPGVAHAAEVAGAEPE
jgi:FSR family fosmidomycin resistance protein-like MFS transporter